VKINTADGELEINGYDENTGVVHYKFTLKNHTNAHANQGQDSQITIPIEITAEDTHGGNATSKIDVTIVDDVPAAKSVTQEFTVQPVDTNLVIIIDISTSMREETGDTGKSRLEFAQDAMKQLINDYDALGNVKVQIVWFNKDAGTVSVDGSTWLSVEDALAAVDDLSIDESGTNYDAALTAAMASFTSTGALDTLQSQNIGYFLSDGEPNRPSGSIGISTSEQATWEAFLRTNDIDMYALGMGAGATATTLQPIAYDGSSEPNGAEKEAVVVTDVTQLADVLSDTVIPYSVNGSLIESTGADKPGYVKSITIDGTTYTYNTTGSGSITWSGSNPGSNYSFVESTNVLIITTLHGSKLNVDMDTGEYLYSSPSETFSNSFTDVFIYQIVDSDGDISQSSGTITVYPPDIPGVFYSGTSGADTYNGGDGDDTISGNSGNDTLTGAAGNDSIDGGADKDVLYGSAGNDTLKGGTGKDILYGGDGNDMLDGGADKDTLIGGSGDDTLIYDSSDTGSNVIDGGDGRDTLIIQNATVMDFSNTILSDRINNIEVIDLVSGQFAGSITNLTYQDVIGITDINKTLYILGDGSDQVHFASGNGWAKGVATTVDGITYDSYSNSNDSGVHVYVQQQISDSIG
jgi:Ca2+-binding RTX toxin-like protein